LQENNFRGEGEKAAISVELFGRTSYDLSWSEPYWDEKDTSVEVNLFDTERRRRFSGGVAVSLGDDKFDERRSGGSLRFSRPLDTEKRKRGSVTFRTEKVSSSSYQGLRTLASVQTAGAVSPASTNWWQQTSYAPNDNANLYRDTPGPGDTLGPVVVAAPIHPGGRLSSIALGYSTDFRDSRLNAPRGTYTSLTTEFAGALLGGDEDFTKVQAEHRRYYPVRGGKDVIAFRLQAGFSLGDIPLFESYSVGGANSLRGYEEDRFRGERMFLGSAEYRHPINDNLSLVGFVDVGDAFGGNFPTVIPGFNLPSEDQSLQAHVGAGVGMRVKTPLGPLRLDFGWGDDGNQAHFSFGQAF
jgi:outer membrane protein insertion porin family